MVRDEDFRHPGVVKPAYGDVEAQTERLDIEGLG